MRWEKLRIHKACCPLELTPESFPSEFLKPGYMPWFAWTSISNCWTWEEMGILLRIFISVNRTDLVFLRTLLTQELKVKAVTRSLGLGRGSSGPVWGWAESRVTLAETTWHSTPGFPRSLTTEHKNKPLSDPVGSSPRSASNHCRECREASRAMGVSFSFNFSWGCCWYTVLC